MNSKILSKMRRLRSESSEWVVWSDSALILSWKVGLFKTHQRSKTHMHVYTVELQWLEHLWDHENLFEAGVVRIH